MGWIGVDLDGCLAQWGTKDAVTDYIHYDVLVIGAPIPKMVERVKALIAAGEDVRIFTARIGPVTTEEAIRALAKAPGYEPSPTPCLDWANYQTTLIETWCKEHLGKWLPITCVKDFHMYQLYDDRCVQVYTNTGETLEDRITELETGLREIAREIATPPGMEEPV
jgi:hypothetical protein